MTPRPPTRVLTIGTFDILHFGHVSFLRQCELLGSEVIVGVNSDRFAATFKTAPVMTQDERQLAIAQVGYATLLNDGPGAELIEQARPGVLAVGSDWARKDYRAQIGLDQDQLDGLKVTVAYVPYMQGTPISTSEIRRRVLAAAPPQRLILDFSGTTVTDGAIVQALAKALRQHARPGGPW